MHFKKYWYDKEEESVKDDEYLCIVESIFFSVLHIPDLNIVTSNVTSRHTRREFYERCVVH
jgi:hypothetical protein